MILDQPIGWIAAGAAIGYLLGSIPFGLFFAWLAGAGDVRNIGSGSIGATNVLRTGKKWAAALTLLFDAAKGAAAVLIARMVFNDDIAMVAALCVILGHIFPVWLGFKGGKAVAAGLGMLLALYWPVALLGAATWLAAAIVWRISSLAALITTALVPLYMVLLHQDAYAILTLIVAALIWFMHRGNISRLLNGKEPRIGASKA